MSGIIGSKLNIRGSGLVGSLGTDGQHLLSAGVGKSNVFETVVAATYDDEPIKSDLTALAIREATNEASAAFNLPSSFIETFTDDTNLATQTTVDRTSGYIETAVTATASADAGGTNTPITASNSTFRANTARQTYGTGDDLGMDNVTYNYNHSLDSDVLTGNFICEFNGTTADFGSTSGSDATQCYQFGIMTSASNAYHAGGTIAGMPPDQNVWYCAFGGDNGTDMGMWRGQTHKSTITSGADGASVRFARFGSTLYLQKAEVIAYTFSSGDFSETGNLNANWSFGKQSGARAFSDCNYQSGMTAIKGIEYTTTNATGTLVQSANTVTGTRTTVGGTFLYKDNAGTASIGTDLKIYFTANGGTNWTEAVGYTAITPVYSTGIKQVRLSETTVTGGTDIRYKAVWANQAASSKETQLHGIGINY